jgi:hypothetical protein
VVEPCRSGAAGSGRGREGGVSAGSGNRRARQRGILNEREQSAQQRRQQPAAGRSARQAEQGTVINVN